MQWVKSFSLFIFSLNILSLSLAPTRIFAQETQDKSLNKTPAFCKTVLDENQHILIPQKGLAILYFYDPRLQDSIQMGDMVENLKLDNSNVVCFKVNIGLASGLKRTYNIINLPSLVIVQDKRVIYGINGFTDNQDAFTAMINAGIENHLIIDTQK